MPDTNTQAALQVLEWVLCLEVDGEQFYRQAATRTADAKGRRMFLALAGMASYEAMVREQYHP